MIEFPCTCGFVFKLQDEEAGGSIQCPRCRRLNDVPTHLELRQIAPDGTYEVSAPHVGRNPDEVVADLTYIYQRGPRDAEGNEIDLRLRDDELHLAGMGDPIPLAPHVEKQLRAPRYDPETGELIRPIEVKTDPSAPPLDPDSIPIAKPAINYATGPTAHRTSFFRLFLQLLSPLNMAVILAVMGMHVLLWPMLMVVFAGIFFLVVAIPIVAGMILAHYGNVIEENGPFDRDELPRPLRNLGWYEDIWAPFFSVAGALLLCYGLLATVPYVTHAPAARPFAFGLAIVLVAAGTFFFPAVLLTLQTSGTSFNLRPDRVLGVIGACGRDYFVAVVLWVFTAFTYGLGWVGTSLTMATLVRNDINLPTWLTAWVIVGPALAVGIFLMHWFCMSLGMLYRFHYEKFPWVLQRHISAREKRGEAGLPPSRRRRRYNT